VRQAVTLDSYYLPGTFKDLDESGAYPDEEVPELMCMGDDDVEKEESDYIFRSGDTRLRLDLDSLADSNLHFNFELFDVWHRVFSITKPF
jgi:hypothetical protein